ncbi:MAG: hypothetical protein M1815_002290 [Lichina confinis]|nr:MAG: hypothetical protein M1815_002290 [Lichina confinis]
MEVMVRPTSETVATAAGMQPVRTASSEIQGRGVKKEYEQNPQRSAMRQSEESIRRNRRPFSALRHDIKTSLAGQLARALAVFCVDEVVVFDDEPHARPVADDEQSYTGDIDPSHFLTHVLLYLETPPHLRRHLFALHPNLQTAGALPSLDMPHHIRADEWCEFREGVTVEHDSGGSNARDGVVEDHARRKIAKTAHTKKRVDSQGENTPRRTFVDAGLRTKVVIEDEIPPKTRVTVRFPNATTTTSAAEPSLRKRKMPDSGDIPAEAVGPDTPREEKGYYWGYNVRRASCISDVFTECPYDGGYDLSFGTSERGVPVESLLRQRGPHPEDDDDNDDASDDHNSADPSTPEDRPPYFKHLLVAFGGPHGLEVAIRNDAVLTVHQDRTLPITPSSPTPRRSELSSQTHPYRCSRAPSPVVDSTHARTAEPGRKRSSTRVQKPHTPPAIAASGAALETLGTLPSPFDHWVNVCPGQGSRTIRTVEAIWITLARLREFVQQN